MRDLLTDPLWRAEDLGHAVPGAEHAVSVCLPLWEHVIGYEENDPAVVGRFACGYPRFFLHPRVRELFAVAAENFARPGETALVFPTAAAASRAAEHVRKKSGAACRIEAFGHHALAALVLPESAREPAWKRWQHGGEIVGSRQAEAALSGAEGAGEAGVAARETVRRHLAELYGQPAGNVFLFASGMAAISAVQRLLAPGSPAAQIEFPYVDTLKGLNEFGFGAREIMRSATGGVDETRALLAAGPVAGVFTELPSNPLLRTADLAALARLLTGTGAPLVVDDTVATAVNADALRHADAVTTSLTKLYSGVGDVMAGAAVVRASSPFAAEWLSALAAAESESPLYGADAVVLAKNGADFFERAGRVNAGAEALFDFLAGHPKVARLWYPKTETPDRYEAVRREGGGYGGLFSLLIADPSGARRFYDALRVTKGPSFGTHFSLASPYTLLAHYRELDWAKGRGVEPHLIRVWTGLEPAGDLIERFGEALAAA
ncbi:MAG: PLP-dependent transferase [Akkermansiaceae bacterium]|nr:PLP-dependent transferase [Akkermansiaceae bacterium]MCP5550199.1 PLP-dependent transferase [Akkermansiaceae bacterium]